MKVSVVICLVLSIVMGTGSSPTLGHADLSSNPYCYAFCVLPCFTGPVECALCIGKCILSAQDSPMDINHFNNAYFCKLGCATSHCTRLLSNARTDGKKVKGCVDSCSRTCSNVKN